MSAMAILLSSSLPFLSWWTDNLHPSEMPGTGKYWHLAKEQSIFLSQMCHVQLNGTGSCSCWPDFTKMACQRLQVHLRNGCHLYGDIPITISCKKPSFTPRDLWPSGKVPRLKGHPSPFPMGIPPSFLTCSSGAIEISNQIKGERRLRIIHSDLCIFLHP